MATITPERFQMLEVIDEVASTQDPKLASVKGIRQVLEKKYTTVAKMLGSLKRRGLIENPMRGRWRLTAIGRETLLRVRAPEASPVPEKTVNTF